MADENSGSVMEDTEVFEITDFTNASPWESFVSEIENILVQWGLTSSEEESVDFNESYYEQHQKSEKLTYAKHTFIISLHVTGEKKKPLPKQSDQDWPRQLVTMMDASNDFPPVAHLITRWFGVDQFVLIAPDESSEALTSEAQSKLMLSSISIATYNVRCTTPIFVQVQKHWRHFYTGVCQGHDIRTNFDTVHMKRTPPQFNHLAGMIDLFKSKIRKGNSVKRTPVQIAARITYYLRHWRGDNWSGVEPLGDFKDGISVESFSTLPLGAIIDPLQELHLSAIWSGLTEDTIIDNNTTSGFNPMNAPLWTVKTHLVDNPGLILHELIHEFMKICHKQDSIEHLLGNKILREDMRSPGVGSSDFSHALTRLTGPQSTITSFSSVMYSSSSRLEFGSEFEPISDEDIDMVLQYIFPDSIQDGTSKLQKEALPESKIAITIKSAHPDSFTARLARVLCIVNKEYGLKAFAHVWYEIVLELRYRWENGITLTRVGDDFAPDMRSCLLNQKFQMLNCCVQHKLSHAQRSRGRTPSTSSSTHTSRSSAEPEFLSPSSSLSFSQRVLSTQTSSQVSPDSEDKNNDSSEEDEFFEAPETPPTETSLEKSIKELSLDETSARSPTTKAKLVDLKPADVDPLSLLSNDLNTITSATNVSKTSGSVVERLGALKPYKDLLLLRTGEQLYIPETQDPAPLTEDMLMEQQQVLSTLGTNEEATHVRAKMQSLSLKSDMQSFKAANPGCVLEDFVRWHSPNDWIEGDDNNEEESEKLKETTPSPERGGIARAQSHPTDGWEGNDDWGDTDWDSITATEEGNQDTTTKYASGHLSKRIRQPGSLWVESWENATPIPIYRQRRLFDDTKEAEKVLHYLSGLKLSELALMLLPLILHSAIIAVEEKLKSMPLSGCENIVNDCINILKTVQNPSLETLPVYQECLSLLQLAEHQLAIADSLLIKLQQGLELGSVDGKTGKADTKELTTSVQILAQDKQELVLREPTTSLTGNALKGLLMAQEVAQQQTKGIPQQPAGFKASAREFILRTVEPYPRPCSSSCPHRMFCLLSKDEMRLSGAFSEDVLFS